MKVRYAVKNEKNIAFNHWRNSFKDSEQQIEFYFNNIFSHKNYLILEKDKKVVSSLHENPYILNFNSNEIKTKYIVGVSTPIEEQRKGYMKTLMREMLKKSSKEMPFIFLTPINPHIYRRFGFEYFSKIESYHFSIENLSKFNTVKDISFIEIDLSNKDEYINDLIKIYNNSMKGNFFCYLKRDKYYFSKLLCECLNEEMKIFISFVNKVPKAYVIFSKYDNKIDIRECFALECDEYNNILGLLYGYRDYYNEINLFSAEGMNLEFLFKNQMNITKKETPFMMLRILKPLEVLNFSEVNIENLKIYIEDNILEYNTGMYVFINGKWEILKNAEDYDFKIDVADLVPLLTGFFTFDELLFMKKIVLKTNKKNKIKQLSSLFKRRKSYLYEFQ